MQAHLFKGNWKNLSPLIPPSEKTKRHASPIAILNLTTQPPLQNGSLFLAAENISVTYVPHARYAQNHRGLLSCVTQPGLSVTAIKVQTLSPDPLIWISGDDETVRQFIQSAQEASNKVEDPKQKALRSVGDIDEIFMRFQQSRQNSPAPLPQPQRTSGTTPPKAHSDQDSDRRSFLKRLATLNLSGILSFRKLFGKDPQTQPE